MKRLLLVFSVLILTGHFHAQEIEHQHSTHYALIENKGQWAEKVLFQSKSQGNNIWVQQHGFIYDIRDYSSLKKAHSERISDANSDYFRGTLVGVEFLNSLEVSEIKKEKPLAYYYNYFIGNDSSKWASNVSSFREATLKNFYPDIDLKIIDAASEFKYELWCAPGTDYKQIQLKMKGFSDMVLDKAGNLILSTDLGKITEKKPIAYQLLNGKLTTISCKFILKKDIVSFELGKHDENATLIIDPVLVFATYSGSPTDNFGMTATYGYDGSAYSGGTIFGNSYPTPDPLAFDVTSNFTTTYNG